VALAVQKNGIASEGKTTSSSGFVNGPSLAISGSTGPGNMNRTASNFPKNIPGAFGTS
jgi:hypothetical protein